MHLQTLPIRTITRAVPRICPSSSSAFSTCTAKRALSKPSSQIQPSRTSIRILLCPKARPSTASQRRFNSTAPAVEAAPTTTPAHGAEPLTWNRFLALRKTRRRISLVTSISCAVVGAGTGLTALFSSNVDLMQFNIDPMFVMGGAFIGSALIGWLFGPFFGNALFNVRYRALRTQIAVKEKEFYNRIKKFRVDPTSSSMQNPVPDYYGEKIGSVRDYRRWLKDQRAFNLKRGKML